LRKFVYFFLALTFITFNIFSQDDEELTYQNTGLFSSAAIGVGVPVGDLDKGYKGSYDFTVDAGYIFSNLYAARLDASYNKFTLDAAYSGGSMNIVSIRGDFLIGNFKKRSNIILYGLGGFGVFFKSSEDITKDNVLIQNGGSETDFGFAVGGGSALRYKNMAFYTELLFNYSFKDKLAPASFVPIKVGVMMIP
jgi:hypothetical protein